MTDSSRESLDPSRLVFLVLSLTLAGIHLYLGVFAPFTPGGRAIQFTVIALALLVGPLLYWTSYWRPILYLLGASLAVYLGVLWSLSGMDYFLVGVRTGIVAVGFVALGIYLFVRSEAAATGA
ncbi:hypothetical protein [Halobacterium sp. R2-5]|uniref:hypothetical protein n=1 Tax=Halobacterium sp. R2-5 TaxID=2715751 RepID=UPI001423DE2B|nr:hypothetical protein [Halobacterium sp. R2-5]NIC00721.1 hypothetical protein [Halobacterium sp. R2-5]